MKLLHSPSYIYLYVYSHHSDDVQASVGEEDVSPYPVDGKSVGNGEAFQKDLLICSIFVYDGYRIIDHVGPDQLPCFGQKVNRYCARQSPDGCYNVGGAVGQRDSSQLICFRQKQKVSRSYIWTVVSNSAGSNESPNVHLQLSRAPAAGQEKPVQTSQGTGTQLPERDRYGQFRRDSASAPARRRIFAEEIVEIVVLYCDGFTEDREFFVVCCPSNFRSSVMLLRRGLTSCSCLHRSLSASRLALARKKRGEKSFAGVL